MRQAAATVIHVIVREPCHTRAPGAVRLPSPPYGAWTLPRQAQGTFMSDLRTAIERATPRRKRWPWVAAAVAVLLVAGGGFALTRGDASTGRSATAGAPVRGGTLQFALIDYQRSPDPQWGTNYAESLIGNNITDKLTWQDPDTGEITPWLAESWEYNKDLTEFTFHLRKDVTFSDGSPFDSEVVKANFDQYVHGDEKLGINPNGAILLPGYIETLTPDRYTAVVRFEKPLASFLQASSFTANAQPGFLSLSTLKLSAEERTDPKKVIGTGPFVYESWQPQVKTVLVRRKGYNWAPPALKHKGEAYLDRIVFNTIPEASVRTGSLTSGAIDATLDVGTTDEKPLADQGFKIIYRGVSGTSIFFNLNSQLFPTDDIAVRRAIQLGWDREAVRKTVLTDSYSVATSVLAPRSPATWTTAAPCSGTTPRRPGASSTRPAGRRARTASGSRRARSSWSSCSASATWWRTSRRTSRSSRT